MSWNNIIPGWMILDEIKSRNSGYVSQGCLDLEPHVYVDKEYLCNVPVETNITTGMTNSKSMSHVNHPTFEATKTWLVDNGYVKHPGYNSWNSHTVAKPFYFNDKYLKEGERFYDACAWHWHFKDYEVPNK